ncbi:kinase-like domain-containing protein [Triangularia verruculosa]|uniref:non-specific serine/threonine protein kinase n=1 Tax=Triangularia verruculosa TaxID=2587418 RepID=A0AAN6XD68_9PEZI|nr:kinase-like domain-containing protein [Triangularia verruculosa]
MASPVPSSDEGEIVEATSLPRAERNIDVDRKGRHQGRYASREPDNDVASRSSAEGHRRRSQSPRGWKRPRDDRDDRGARDRRDPRQFRVHYEDNNYRDDRRQGRDLDRPSSRGSELLYDERPSQSSGNRDYRGGSHRHADDRSRTYDRGYGRDRGFGDYPDKRPRNHNRSPRDHRDRGRRDRGRNGPDRYASDQHKYSAHVERQSQDGQISKKASPVGASGVSKNDAKTDQGSTVERGINGLAISQNRAPPQDPAQDAELDMDWDPDAAMDEEAKERAEIERRRRLREAAYKRGIGASTPTIQSLQADDKTVSTPASTRQSTPGLLRVDASTPKSNDMSSPALSPGKAQEELSTAALNFADDQALINVHVPAKLHDEDGPSAADYDPTADMQEDEKRDEQRHGTVGLHGQPRVPFQPEAATDAAPAEQDNSTKKVEEDDDDFDMFADDFDEQKFAAAAPLKTTAVDDSRLQQGAGGGGNIEGDDKDGYYKIRPGEVLDGRYQILTTLGRGMFSGVARAVDITNKQEVAIKIMRNNDALRKGGFTEIAILQKLNAADPDNKRHLVRFERSFEYKGHLCMAFENLSMNLREVLKKFGNNVGINLNATRIYASQIFIALGHMRKCSIIHADLKPDNILVNEARNVLKICDLGTAIDRSDAATASTEITPYLVSRFYRAPEIILGMPYDYAVDMWSIGCTLYELYTGKILFTGDSNNQMLKNIMEIRGKLSAKIYRRGQLSSMHFDELGNFISVERDKVLGKVSGYDVFFPSPPTTHARL